MYQRITTDFTLPFELEDWEYNKLSEEKKRSYMKVYKSSVNAMVDITVDTPQITQQDAYIAGIDPVPTHTSPEFGGGSFGGGGASGHWDSGSDSSSSYDSGGYDSGGDSGGCDGGGGGGD